MRRWYPKTPPGAVKVHKNGSTKYEFDFKALREADTPVGRALVAMETAAGKHGIDLDLTVKRPISDRMQRFGHGYEWMYDSGFPCWKFEISTKKGERIFLREVDGEFKLGDRLTERSAFGKAVREGWSALDNWLQTKKVS